ncbi:ubiquitin carboxyl-terminal hydrolase, partial [Reticulomyxa filosa]
VAITINVTTWKALVEQFGSLMDMPPLYAFPKQTDEEPTTATATNTLWLLSFAFANNCAECKQQILVHQKNFENNKVGAFKSQNQLPFVALSMKWVIQWRNWILNKTQDIPGPIDNRHIADKNRKLKEGVKIEEDYICVPLSVWNFLQNIYNGGPRVIIDFQPNNKDNANDSHHDGDNILPSL